MEKNQITAQVNGHPINKETRFNYSNGFAKFRFFIEKENEFLIDLIGERVVVDAVFNSIGKGIEVAYGVLEIDSFSDDLDSYGEITLKVGNEQ